MEECIGGYYSLGGATKCTYCPAGYQCPTKTVCEYVLLSIVLCMFTPASQLA